MKQEIPDGSAAEGPYEIPFDQVERLLDVSHSLTLRWYLEYCTMLTFPLLVWRLPGCLWPNFQTAGDLSQKLLKAVDAQLVDIQQGEKTAKQFL